MAFAVGPDGSIDASRYGVLPGTDCTTALQALVGVELPADAWIKLKGGTYTVTAPIDAYTGVKNSLHTDHLWIRGAGSDATLGTIIRGSVAGPILAYNRNGVDAASSVILEGIGIENTNAAGTGLRLERIDYGYIANCRFGKAFRGCVIGEIQQTNVDINFFGCRFDGDLNTFAASLGLAGCFNGGLHGCCAFRWGTAAWRITGSINITAAHLEVNPGYAIQTGVNPDGGQSSLPSQGSWNGVVIENCGTAVRFEKETYRTHINYLNIHNPSEYGIWHRAGARSLNLSNCFIDGTVTGNGIRLSGAGPVYLNDVNVNVSGGADWLDEMPTLTINNVSAVANPTITTTAAHGLREGQNVLIASVGGATGVNGRRIVCQVPSTTTFRVVSDAPGTYTSGGTVANANLTMIKGDYA